MCYYQVAEGRASFSLQPVCGSSEPSRRRLSACRSFGKPTLVAVGTAITRRPPHRPVLALLTHTVPTSDVGMFGVEAHVRIGLQDLDRREQATQAFPEALPTQTAALASTPKRLKPDTQHIVAERLQSRPVTRNGVIFYPGAIQTKVRAKSRGVIRCFRRLD